MHSMVARPEKVEFPRRNGTKKNGRRKNQLRQTRTRRARARPFLRSPAAASTDRIASLTSSSLSSSLPNTLLFFLFLLFEALLSSSSSSDSWHSSSFLLDVSFLFFPGEGEVEFLLLEVEALGAIGETVDREGTLRMSEDNRERRRVSSRRLLTFVPFAKKSSQTHLFRIRFIFLNLLLNRTRRNLFGTLTPACFLVL